MSNLYEPFETLERDLGIAAFKELLDLFKNTFPIKLNKIDKEIDAKNFESIFFDTHQMVSSAANMGAHEIARLVKELEAVLRSSDLQKGHETLDKIRTEFAIYIANADNYLSSGSHGVPLGV